MRILGHRATRVVFALVAAAAITVAFIRALEDAGYVPLPSPPRLVAGGVALLVGMVVAGSVWSVLIPGRRFAEVAPGYFVAQMGKYIPGSLWQGVGQVMDAVRLGVGRGAATVAYLVQIGTQAIAGGVVAVLVLFARPSGWILLASVVAPAGVLLLHRRWMRLVLQFAARVAPRRLGHLPQTLPAQRSIIEAALLGVVTMFAVSCAYAFLLLGPIGGATTLAAVGAFALAWTVGFLVVPLPAGIGVRELVLVAVLAEPYGPAAVLAAAVIHRVVLIVVEAGLAAAAQVLRRVRSDPDPSSRGIGR